VAFDDRPNATFEREPATGLWMIETDAARHASEAIRCELWGVPTVQCRLDR
jgi:hypothetical protein